VDDEASKEEVMIVVPASSQDDNGLTSPGFSEPSPVTEKEIAPVYVVEAVTSVGAITAPQAQPLVSEGDDDTADVFDDGNAVQESRIHTTVAESEASADEEDTNRKREIATGKPEPGTSSTKKEMTTTDMTSTTMETTSETATTPKLTTSSATPTMTTTRKPQDSYDMVVNVLSLFDLPSLAKYLSGEKLPEKETSLEGEEEATSTTVTTTTMTTTRVSTKPTRPFITANEPKTTQTPVTSTVKESLATTERSPAQKDPRHVDAPASGLKETTIRPKKKYTSIQRATVEKAEETDEITTPKYPLKKYVTIVRTTDAPAEEEAETTTEGPAKKEYVVIDMKDRLKKQEEEIEVEDEAETTTTVEAFSTEEPETTTSKRQPRIVIVGGGRADISIDDVKPDSSEEEEEPVEKGEDEAPIEGERKEPKKPKFKFSRDAVRSSTFDVLKEINSKNFQRQREETRREALRKAFGNGRNKKSQKKHPVQESEEEEASATLDVEDESKLAERRKQLFSSRAKSSSSATVAAAAKAKAASVRVHPIEALKKKASKPRAPSSSPAALLAARRPPPPILRAASGPAPPRPSLRPFSRPQPTARAESKKKAGPTQEERLRSLRCRLLKTGC